MTMKSRLVRELVLVVRDLGLFVTSTIVSFLLFTALVACTSVMP
jgi:hypothetical protein